MLGFAASNPLMIWETASGCPGNVKPSQTVIVSLPPACDPAADDGAALATEPDPTLGVFVQEMYRHHKTLAFLDTAWAEAVGLEVSAQGVTNSPRDFFEALALHRHWGR